jgi:hypothetical protein
MCNRNNSNHRNKKRTSAAHVVLAVPMHGHGFAALQEAVVQHGQRDVESSHGPSAATHMLTLSFEGTVHSMHVVR